MGVVLKHLLIFLTTSFWAICSVLVSPLMWGSEEKRGKL